MSNRDFSEDVQGPRSTDGPSVDDLRAEMYGGQVAGRFHYRESRTERDSAVIQGTPVLGDGTMTDDQAAEIRKSFGIGADLRHAAQAAESYMDRRDPTSGHTIRTYGNGRVVDLDAEPTQTGSDRVEYPRVWYGDDPGA
ncbi:MULTISPECIES: hypothetical protein [Streptomyces]|uniref:Uncharacterized protein n=1 Tax=Streptomyces coelicolor (strain ATCC BAA-471 / A3(2) / M145) TaxID=100226 RepID=O69905_STRCO|nr:MULTISPECIES: hypothetical protein [Streptomyces]MDX2929605.1 hypothetical protein [Streptomyces sp. NRRL_B-16638]MYU45140.1 hypothetical protein [Streptomyces sp. SID7813]NSL84808.1 hypothetical protein [Streptomyces coelicolor]QFI45479.1 hypothetical protein FQ762_29035 [Streptomyces coelicolor A3(2)]QKN69075.1 hypothetical protein HCU77_28470 [Streptomyces coelicolor]